MDHVRVNGTNIFIIPPATFEFTDNYKGFQNLDDPFSMIMVMEIPGPYSETTLGFNQEMLEAQGMELISLTEDKVSEFDGMLIELDQDAGGVIFSK